MIDTANQQSVGKPAASKLTTTNIGFVGPKNTH